MNVCECCGVVLDIDSECVVYGHPRQDYPGGPIYRVGSSTSLKAAARTLTASPTGQINPDVVVPVFSVMGDS